MKKTLAILTVIAVIAGCHLAKAPATNPAEPHLVTAATAIEATGEHLEKAGAAVKADNPPEATKEIEAAKETNQQAGTEVEQAKDETVTLASALSDEQRQHADDVSKLNGELSKEHQKRVDAEELYKSSWFGGKFYFWLHVVEASTAFLLAAGLLLNYYTDFFVWAAIPLHWLLKLLGAIVGGFLKLVKQVGTSIANLFTKKKS